MRSNDYLRVGLLKVQIAKHNNYNRAVFMGEDYDNRNGIM